MAPGGAFCTPGSEWLKLTNKQRPKDRLWTASDEETSFPSAIALPGHENLGLGRHWHFLADFAWLLTGLVYVVMLFVTPEWQRLIPTSWQIVPDAWHAMLRYLSLHVVETPGAYNALQQLSYAAVIFLLAPFSIATGVAMSPAVAARFPWYCQNLSRKAGRTDLHFLALCAFLDLGKDPQPSGVDLRELATSRRRHLGDAQSPGAFRLLKNHELGCSRIAASG